MAGPNDIDYDAGFERFLVWLRSAPGPASLRKAYIRAFHDGAIWALGKARTIVDEHASNLTKQAQEKSGG